MFGDGRSVEHRISGFEDFELIGWGGFGVVYRAHQPKLNRDVAIKVLVTAGLDERVRRRFDREQKAMGALSNHPSIVTLHEAGYTEQGLPYLAMELMDGGSIATRLATSGPLPWREAIELVVPIAGAIEAAHRAGVLHRDIKPANILISRYGEAKLTDFGIAALAQGTATATRSITTTVEHAPPEVLNGDPPTAVSDVYSLGSTLFTLLSGYSPFRREADESVLVIMGRIATEAVPDLRLRAVPHPICEALERSLAKDPSVRPQGAAEFASLLEQAQRKVEAAPPQETLPTAVAAEATTDTTDEPEADEETAVGVLEPTTKGETPEPEAAAAAKPKLTRPARPKPAARTEPEPVTHAEPEAEAEVAAPRIATAQAGTCHNCGVVLEVGRSVCSTCREAEATEPWRNDGPEADTAKPQYEVAAETRSLIAARPVVEITQAEAPPAEKAKHRLPRLKRRHLGTAVMVLMVLLAGTAGVYFLAVVGYSFLRRELGEGVEITWTTTPTTTATPASTVPAVDPVLAVLPARGGRDELFNIVMMGSQPGQQVTIRVYEPLGALHSESAAAADDSGLVTQEWHWEPGDPFGPYEVRVACVPDPSEPGSVENTTAYFTVTPVASVATTVDPPAAGSATTFLIRVTGATPAGRIRLRVLQPSDRVDTDAELAADSQGARVFSWRWAWPDAYGDYTAIATDLATGDTDTSTFSVTRILDLRVAPNLGDRDTTFVIVVTGATPGGEIIVSIDGPGGVKYVDARRFRSPDRIVYGWYASDRSEGRYTVTATDPDTQETLTATFTIGF